METNKIALFDLDGSLAGYVEQLLSDLERLRGPGDPIITAENIWDMDKFPYIRARMDFIKNSIGWWRNLPVIESGVRVFREAARIGFHNIVLTKAPARCPHAWTEKVEWSRDKLDRSVDVSVTSTTKGLVYGRILFDDSKEYALEWLDHRHRGLVIMPDTLYNRDFSHPQVLRWTGGNWDEVVAALKECYDRPEVRSN